MDGAVESEEVAMAMIADVHHAPADGPVPVDDVEFQESEIRVLGPVMGHGVDLRVVGEPPCRSPSWERGYKTALFRSSPVFGRCSFYPLPHGERAN